MAEKNYFHPWEGKNKNEGINGNTILIVGVQHWCDPSQWNCDKSPLECLQKRDKTCTVWNEKVYEKNDIKSAWWIKGNKENKMQQCPLYKNCEFEDKEILCSWEIRFLHCETKISVYDHIISAERTKRTDIFALVFESLVKIFGSALRKECNIKKPNVSIIDLTPEELNEDEKKGYWDRIVFTNYIQHYTKLLPGGRFDPIELSRDPETDKKRIEECLKIFKDKHRKNVINPDVIIILKEEEIYKRVFLQVKEIGYVPLKRFTVPGKFYVLAKTSSNLYQSSANMEDFIKYCIDKWNGNIKTSHIVKLAYYLEQEHKWKKTAKDRYEGIVKLCPIDIQKDYYKENDNKGKKFCYDKLRRFTSDQKKRGESNENTNEIEDFYNEWKGKTRFDRKDSKSS